MTPPPRLLTADRGDAGRRLDLVLRRHLSDVNEATRTRVQAWIEAGQVTVNGRLVRRVSSRTAAGDMVAVILPDTATRAVMRPEPIELAILYEDDYLLALNKPAGVVVHPTYKHAEHTMMNALLWHGRHWAPPERPSIVGRLDKQTSGLVIVAKTGAVHAALQRDLTSPSGTKDYLAVVYGRVDVASGAIELPLRLDPRDRRRVVVSEAEGAYCLTRFERMAQVEAPRVGLSLLRCRLMTGRTHQIRVHLSARGWPIVGDPKYGEPRWSEIDDPGVSSTLETFARQALHSYRVVVAHPVTRDELVLEAPVPDDLRHLLRATMDIDIAGWPPLS